MGSPRTFDQRLPPELAGFGPDLFDDIRDLVACYGADVRGVPGIRRMNLPTDPPCQVTTTVPPSKKANLAIRPFPSDGDVSRVVILVLQDHPAVPYVQWDRRVTAAELIAAMAQVDADMAPTRDPLTGKRQRVPSDRYAPPPLMVDQVFADGRVMVIDREIDPDALRQQFDRPDDLAVLADVNGHGNPGLCRKADLMRNLQADEITVRVLAKYGVKGQDQIDAMPRDRLQAMLAEIEAELDKLG